MAKGERDLWIKMKRLNHEIANIAYEPSTDGKMFDKLMKALRDYGGYLEDD